jgi:hypothetical protein
LHYKLFEWFFCFCCATTFFTLRVLLNKILSIAHEQWARLRDVVSCCMDEYIFWNFFILLRRIWLKNMRKCQISNFWLNGEFSINFPENYPISNNKKRANFHLINSIVSSDFALKLARYTAIQIYDILFLTQTRKIRMHKKVEMENAFFFGWGFIANRVTLNSLLLSYRTFSLNQQPKKIIENCDLLSSESIFFDKPNQIFLTYFVSFSEYFSMFLHFSVRFHTKAPSTWQQI